jgi:hypothetical protein
MDEYIVFDTETTTDETQRFVFGCFRYLVRHNGKFHTLAEGLIHADDLADTDPEAYRELFTYVQRNSADVNMRFMGPREPDWHLHLISRKQFVERWIWDVGYKRDAIISGFNLPFDFSRIALAATEARAPFTDGFSFQLWDYTMRPNLRIKHLDNKKSFIGWSFSTIPDAPKVRGRFIDLRTATFALTNVAHTLDSACAAFECDTGKYQADEHGVVNHQYIAYCRNDVKATTELLGKVTEEYERHPLAVPLNSVYSPATLSKGYYKAMGIKPPMQKFSLPDEVYGKVMSSFYGARTECRIRGVKVPVTVVDFTSMYPTVNALMGMWGLLTARDVLVRDETDRVRDMLETVTLDDCFTPAQWRRFIGIARIRPDDDVLPVRAQYGADSNYNIGVNHLTYDGDLWYAIPDLVASKILTGKSPEILEAIQFVPVGQQPGLKKVALRSETVIDPMGADFFTWVIEQRARVRQDKPQLAEFLKVLSNAGSYGIFAEMVRDDSVGETTVDMFSAPETPWRARVRHAERPGQYAFPPVASCITAAARLMLAMLEKCVTDAGGTWVFCDTDSMAIVSKTAFTRPGTFPEELDFPALDARVIDAIIARFDALSPYDKALIPHVLKKEYVGYCYAISSKRYALFDGNGIVEKYSEHGLGHLKGPFRDWKKVLWSIIVGGELGVMDAWLDTPALSQWSVSTPRLYRTLDIWNTGKPYRDQIKPFNFLSAVFIRKEHRPRLRPGIKGIQLITGYLGDKDPMEAEWINKYDPKGYTYNVTWNGVEGVMFRWDVVKVVTYREVLADYRIHPEVKFADENGKTCGPHTTGQLYRHHVQLAGVDYIGKESNKVDDVQEGLFEAKDAQLVATPGDLKWDQMRETVFRVLARYNATENARLLGMSRREYERIRAGDSRPHQKMRTNIVAMAVHVACEDLKRSPKLIKDPRSLLMEWRMKCGSVATSAK